MIIEYLYYISLYLPIIYLNKKNDGQKETNNHTTYNR